VAGKARGSRRRRNVLVGVLVAALVCTGLAMFMQIGETPEDREKYDYASSLSPAPDGVKALYTLLGELGYRTRRSMDAFDGTALEETDVLVTVQPLRPMTDVEEEALRSWIEEGGTMVIAGDLSRGAVFSQPSLDPDDPFVRHNPLKRDTHEAIDGEQGEQLWRKEPSELKPRLLAGVDSFAYRHILTDRTREIPVKIDEPAWRRGPHEVLVGGTRSFVEVSTLGSGRVIKLGDEHVLMNRSIAMANNLVFVLNVLGEYGDGGRIAFDEAHRQMAMHEQQSVFDVLGPASRVALLQLLVAVLAGLVAVGWRSAPPLPERLERRRRALEQVEALASMMERAGAARLAVKLLHRRTSHLWRKGRFMPAPGPHGAELTGRQARLFARMERYAARVESGAGADRRDLVRYIVLLRQLKRGEKKR
jgi:hypothetical protein